MKDLNTTEFLTLVEKNIQIGEKRQTAWGEDYWEMRCEFEYGGVLYKERDFFYDEISKQQNCRQTKEEVKATMVMILLQRFANNLHDMRFEEYMNKRKQKEENK